MIGNSKKFYINMYDPQSLEESVMRLQKEIDKIHAKRKKNKKSNEIIFSDYQYENPFNNCSYENPFNEFQLSYY